MKYSNGCGIIPAVLVYTKDFVSMIKEKSTMTKEISPYVKENDLLVKGNNSNCIVMVVHLFWRTEQSSYYLGEGGSFIFNDQRAFELQL